jgi:hypothetical protein
MPYQCHFLDDYGQTVRTEVLRASDTPNARREAMTRMTRVGGFAGFELWAGGREVLVYRPLIDRIE